MDLPTTPMMKLATKARIVKIIFEQRERLKWYECKSGGYYTILHNVSIQLLEEVALTQSLLMLYWRKSDGDPVERLIWGPPLPVSQAPIGRFVHWLSKITRIKLPARKLEPEEAKRQATNEVLRQQFQELLAQAKKQCSQRDKPECHERANQELLFQLMDRNNDQKPPNPT